MSTGRPLRFLGATLGGWITIRIALLWPGIETFPDLVRALAPPLAAAERPLSAASPPGSSATRRTPPAVPRGIWLAAKPDDTTPATLPLPLVRSAKPFPMRQDIATIPPPLRPTPIATRSRWSGSAWLLARGGTAGTLSGGRLGASQAGMRIGYALDRRRRLAIVGRIATPLAGKGREVAIGAEWQPTRAPVRLVAEQRFALDGGRGGPTLMVIGGIGPVDLLPGIRLEAYGQAGGIARNDVEGFADGAARLTHRLLKRGRVAVDLGIGGWGAAQRDAARFDIGPTIGLSMPVAGTTLRANLDWRRRIAGAAAPGSGPALSIGADF